MTVSWAQARGAELTVLVVSYLECPPWWIYRRPCLPTSLRCLSVPSVSTMSSHRSYNVRAGTLCAPAAVLSCRAARRAAGRSATYATWQWRRSPVMSCSHVNTPTRVVQLHLCTLRKQNTRRRANFDLTPALVPVPHASGRAAWTKWCSTWWLHTKASLHFRVKTLCF